MKRNEQLLLFTAEMLLKGRIDTLLGFSLEFVPMEDSDEKVRVSVN